MSQSTPPPTPPAEDTPDAAAVPGAALPGATDSDATIPGATIPGATGPRAIRPGAANLGIAVAAVAAGAAARAAIHQAVGGGAPFVTFFPAVLVATLYGGVAAGLVATLLSAAAALVWMRGPGGGWQPDSAGAVSVALFVVVSLFMVWLCRRVRRAEAGLRQAKEAGDQSLAQLRAVISSMTEGVVVADAAGNLLDWNRAALDAHGYQSVEQVRQQLYAFERTFEISDGGRRLGVADWPMSRVLRGERFQNVELRVRRLDEPRELVIDFSGSPVYDPQGRLMLAVLTLHDVTEERRAQRAQRENAERLSLAMDAAGQGAWEWDAATDVLTLSPAAAELFGHAPGAAVTRSAMREKIHDADRDRARRANERAVAGQGDYDVEYRLKQSGGEAVWVAARGRGQYDADGQITRMLGVVQDVTPRKLAEQGLRESREWLELAVSIAQMGTFQIDLRHAWLTLNPAGRAIYGFGDSESLTFDAVHARFHPDDADDVAARVRGSMRADGSRRFDVEHRVIRTDGSVRWVRVRGRTLFDDADAGDPGVGPRAVRCVGTFIDVTEQKEAEQHREHLLAAEQAARAAAEQASRMKDEFLTTLSHELRTPLNAILGWSQILLPGAGADEDLKQGLAVIERNARAQAQIIEDLLDMSRIVSGKVRLDVRPIDVAQIARTALDTVRPTADAKGVVLRAALDVGADPVAGDPGRLQQVLWNLLTNAIKFTPAAGEVRVSVRTAGRHVELVVADTGEGVRPEFLPHVFDRFRQADSSTTRRHGGLGLGLAIVKQLAELHGGTVRAESPGPGLGTTFVVLLPVMAPAPVAGSGAGPQASHGDALAVSPAVASLAGVRVLVVDDEPDARAMIRRLLEDHAAVVVTAASADEAVAALDAGPRPGVIVSDIGMPGEDGYGLIARVRRRPPSAAGDVPAVALTAYARAEDRARAIAAGFQGHLCKPVDAAALLTTVVALASGRPAASTLPEAG